MNLLSLSIPHPAVINRHTMIWTLVRSYQDPEL